MLRILRAGSLALTLVLAAGVLAARPAAVHAQEVLEDVVYLKDGSVIRGTIIEQRIGESILIRTRDGNVFRYTMDRIDRITKEAAVGAPAPAGVSRLGPVAGAKSPGTAALFSVLIWGGGQFYNEETTKGVIMLALGVGFFALALDGVDEYGCDPTEYCAPWALPVGITGMLGVSVWSIVDASAGAKRWNRAHGLAGASLELRPSATRLPNGGVGIGLLQGRF